MNKELSPEQRGQGENEGLAISTEIEILQDEEIDSLIELLRRPTQALTAEAYLESIAKRQESGE